MNEASVRVVQRTRIAGNITIFLSLPKTTYVRQIWCMSRRSQTWAGGSYWTYQNQVCQDDIQSEDDFAEYGESSGCGFGAKIHAISAIRPKHVV